MPTRTSDNSSFNPWAIFFNSPRAAAPMLPNNPAASIRTASWVSRRQPTAESSQGNAAGPKRRRLTMAPRRTSSSSSTNKDPILSSSLRSVAPSVPKISTSPRRRWTFFSIPPCAACLTMALASSKLMAKRRAAGRAAAPMIPKAAAAVARTSGSGSSVASLSAAACGCASSGKANSTRTALFLIPVSLCLQKGRAVSTMESPNLRSPAYSRADKHALLTHSSGSPSPYTKYSEYSCTTSSLSARARPRRTSAAEHRTVGEGSNKVPATAPADCAARGPSRDSTPKAVCRTRGSAAPRRQQTWST
mmetsp:Transcript_26325/g.68038  ORF Transcript_26325/g.68038 Transcript_26325/m.68038 type:complete len:305 (-) Transcript_26325:748-1662(-)